MTVPVRGPKSGQPLFGGKEDLRAKVQESGREVEVMSAASTLPLLAVGSMDLVPSRRYFFYLFVILIEAQP
jgi:hypothetical protein